MSKQIVAKNWEMRNKKLTKELRQIKDFKNMDEDFEKSEKENWQRGNANRTNEKVCCQRMENATEVSIVAESGGQVGTEQEQSDQVQRKE